MKTIISCLALVACVAFVAQANPVKRSIILTSPVASVVAAPVAVRTVAHNPTTVVKTEQVHSGDQSSYSYSSEVRSNPAVVQTVAHTPVVSTSHVVASAPVVAAAPAVVSSSYLHTVPAYNYGYYPYSYSYYPYSYGYTPASYLLKKK